MRVTRRTSGMLTYRYPTDSGPFAVNTLAEVGTAWQEDALTARAKRCPGKIVVTLDVRARPYIADYALTRPQAIRALSQAMKGRRRDGYDGWRARRTIGAILNQLRLTQ